MNFHVDVVGGGLIRLHQYDDEGMDRVEYLWARDAAKLAHDLADALEQLYEDDWHKYVADLRQAHAKDPL